MICYAIDCGLSLPYAIKLQTNFMSRQALRMHAKAVNGLVGQTGNALPLL
jgi:hypothetical protein